ncbi:LacI family transcriptional regulator [Bogoriella caseilytica]|uniref:LacI family transcriptional regulator n=2 Tax=Bogoriella caseilytica TaxID=56055 RepID=A0A3N2BFP1_9MICO|nr:LacI family transcriptional regulator [Bogoriella caseilytica]
MRDVAAYAGVSVKTVSRVVNGEPHIRPETQRQVQEAIATLDWRPNSAARTLRTGRTGIVGICVAGLRRPFLAAMVEALVSEIDRRGLRAAVEPTHDDPERIAQVWAAQGRSFDGVLMVGTPAGFTWHPPRGPVVLVDDGSPLATAEVDRVDPDRDEAARLIARHLAVMGRSRPAVLGADVLARPAADGVSAPFAASLEAVGIDPSGVHAQLLPLAADRESGWQAALSVLESAPETDAMVCTSDEVALGALAGLASVGVAVPGRVAVLGYGNLEDGHLSTPTLTTVDPDPAHMARAAVELLAERMSGRATGPPRRVITPVNLIRRESTLGGR